MEGGTGRGVVAAIAATTWLVLCGTFACVANAASPLAWSGPVSIDHQPEDVVLSVSCAGPRLCVAVDNLGKVMTSTHPTGGAAAWSRASLDDHWFNSVSCPTKSLCVAVDNAGDVATSVYPQGGSLAWQMATIDPGHRLFRVSCTPQSVCFAVDFSGNVFASENPTGGAGAWRTTHIGTGG